MKNITLKLFFIFLIWSPALQAQDTLLVVNPTLHELDLTVEQEIFDDYYYTQDFVSILTNISADTLQLIWELEVISAPNEWESYVGDNNVTYIPGITTNYDPDLGLDVLVQILPGAESFIGLFIFLRSTAGCGKYNIHFSKIEEPDSIILTLPIDICYNLATATQDLDKPSISLFPNPTHSFFMLSQIMDNPVLLKNATGKIIRTFSPQNQYDINGISPGYYWIQTAETDQATVLPLVITR